MFGNQLMIKISLNIFRCTLSFNGVIVILFVVSFNNVSFNNVSFDTVSFNTVSFEGVVFCILNKDSNMYPHLIGLKSISIFSPQIFKEISLRLHILIQHEFTYKNRVIITINRSIIHINIKYF